MLPEKFEIKYNEEVVAMEELYIANQAMFRALFKSKIPPLVLMRATKRDGKKFWTSVPEGRQELAEVIGGLIEQYFRAKK